MRVVILGDGDQIDDQNAVGDPPLGDVDAVRRESSDGRTWTGNTALHESSKAAPSLAVFDNRLWVSFIANNNASTVLVCSSSDGHTWTGNVPVKL